MESNKNKNLWIGLVVVIIIFCVMFWFFRKASAPETTSNNSIPVVNPAENINTNNTGVSTAKPSISYANALIKYKNARLQLDKTCQADIDKMTFKNNSSLMIDNRAPVARTVKVGSTFSIKAYGFKIIQLSSSTLPATWFVDCDKSQNVATILIQK
jgi:hypothetical protein